MKKREKNKKVMLTSSSPAETKSSFIFGVDSPVSIASFTMQLPFNNNASQGNGLMASLTTVLFIMSDSCTKKRKLKAKTPTCNNV
jgi:hypothetical protein